MRAYAPLVVTTLLACSAPVGSATTESDDTTAHAPAVHAPAGVSDSPEVRVVVEPGDHGAALVAGIQAATRSVHMTMYLLTDQAVQSALIDRHRAGVEVKVVLNARFDVSGNPNQAAFDAFQAAGVPVVWAPKTYTFTHEKCVVIDGTDAWIMTMNAGKASLEKNREYLAVDSTPADVAEAEAQFAADFAQQPYTPTGNLLMSPVTSRPGLVALINSAQQSIDFEVEEFSDAAIASAMCAASGRHVAIRGVLSSQSPSTTAQRAISQLKTCGIDLLTLAHPYIHAKAIVADGTRVYIGSANFSQTSLDHNRELGLVTSNAAAVATVWSTVKSDIAAGTAL
jgi:phosphatidylserine/phosphatidylglycerophosphate/cardiolipin synthase-like enzyme